MNHRPIESEVMTAELRVRQPLVKRGEPLVEVIAPLPGERLLVGSGCIWIRQAGLRIHRRIEIEKQRGQKSEVRGVRQPSWGRSGGPKKNRGQRAAARGAPTLVGSRVLC